MVFGWINMGFTEAASVLFIQRLFGVSAVHRFSEFKRKRRKLKVEKWCLKVWIWGQPL